jgi:hypothetical protein
MPEKPSFHHPPLRKLGFEYVPAVPLDIPGMADTPVRLGTIARAYLRRPCGRRLGW